MTIEDFSRRIHIMTDNLEEYTRRKQASLSSDQSALVDALAMINTIRLNKLPPEEICAQLRGSALRIQGYSPVLTAMMEGIADQYQTMKGQNHDTITH